MVLGMVLPVGDRVKTLRPFQVKGVETLLALCKSRGGAVLADDMGCVDGSAEIIVQRNRATRRIPLAILFEKFHRLGGEWRCRSLVGEIFRQSLIRDMISSGRKPCFTVDLEGGKQVTCTADHLLMTTAGWVRTDALTSQHTVLTNGRKYNVGAGNANWKGGRVIDSDGYVLIWSPDHPNAVQGKVREHRLVMEAMIGRPLEAFEVVHHKDENKQNNQPSNLELMTQSEHAKEHAPEKWRSLDGGSTINGGEVIILPRYSRVLGVRLAGVRETFDIKMAGPHHNFVADRVVVHNCGKTLQATTTALRLTEKGGVVMVVCPASVRHQWVAEVKEAGAEEVRVLGPPSEKKFAKEWDALREDGGKWVITSYNLAEKAALLVRPKVLVVDEAHNVKGRSNPWAKTLRKLGTGAMYRMAITGTPMWTRPRDFWSLLSICFGQQFGSSYEFDKRYCDGKDGAWGWVNTGSSNLAELKTRMGAVTLRRTKGEVALELPALSRSVRWVDGTKKAAAAFTSSMLGGVKDKNVYFEAMRTVLEEKMPTAVDACVEAGRFLCFTYLREHAEEMARRIEKEGVKCYAVTGSHSSEQRRLLVEKASREGAGVVATLGAASTGLNLQGLASTGIMHAITPVANEAMQAESRLHRMGQYDPVSWTYIAMRSSLDEQTVNTLVDRLDTWNKTVKTDGDGSQDLKRSLSSGVDEALMQEIMKEWG